MNANITNGRNIHGWITTLYKTNGLILPLTIGNPLVNGYNIYIYM